MSWSQMNHRIAEQVDALLDTQKDAYPPDVARFYSRDTAAALIHAAIWGYSVRADSTAGVYAAENLFEALGLKAWSFDAEEAKEFQALRHKRQRDALKET